MKEDFGDLKNNVKVRFFWQEIRNEEMYVLMNVGRLEKMSENIDIEFENIKRTLKYSGKH